MTVSVDKAFVINLDSRTDRLEEFFRQVDSLDLDFVFERLPAVDGIKIPKPSWYWPPRGAWGCFLSHLFAILKAASSGAENVLIVEDDCVFREDFKKNFEICLSELPINWDMFYIGGEHIETEYCPPVQTDYFIAKASSVNLTTGYLLNKSAYNTVLSKIFDFDRFKYNPNTKLNCIQHVDRQFASMAREGLLNVYSAVPWLVGQDSGVSDVGCYERRDKKVFYDYDAIKNAIQINDNVKLLHHRCSYGGVGIDGQMGYENLETNPPFDGDTVSLHAPSMCVVATQNPVYFYAYIDGKNDAESVIDVRCNEKKMGTIQTAGEYTEPMYLEAGYYTIELSVRGKNNFAHTVLCFRDEPFTPLPCGSWIEIMSNALCPRSCQCCNQESFMASNPDYSYTPENAEKLVKALESSGASVNLLFSGGEPMLWEHMDEVVAILRKCENVKDMGVTTSQESEEHIERMKSLFDKVYFSKRKDMQIYYNAIPEYLKGNVCMWWNVRHVPWPTDMWRGDVHCCCSDVGVRCAVIGDNAYPCVVAENLRLMDKWPDLKPIPVDEYFSGAKTFGKIGCYDACRLCVNNRPYRNDATQIIT